MKPSELLKKTRRRFLKERDRHEREIAILDQLPEDLELSGLYAQAKETWVKVDSGLDWRKTFGELLTQFEANQRWRLENSCLSYPFVLTERQLENAEK